MAFSMARTTASLLAGALVLLGAAGCRGASSAAPPAPTSTSAAPATPNPDTNRVPGPAAPAHAGGVNCAAGRCSTTLDPAHATVQVVGTTVTLRTVDSGRAALQVGRVLVHCLQGQTVVAGPYELTCTMVAGKRASLVIARS